MRALALPYPVSVGRIEGGEWSSSVPDRVVVEGRLGVPLGASLDAVRAAFAAVLADGEEPPVEVEWTGGQFAPGETDPAHPWVRGVAAAVRSERGGAARPAGVPYGADMRLFCARGIPTVMVGTRGLELAHAVDERVRVEELEAVARVIVRAVLSF
jgi:acetylornithine deacetylase